MTKYIIGTVSELDTPMNAAAKGALCLNAWYTGYTEEDFQREREEILDAGPEEIRRLAGDRGGDPGSEQPLRHRQQGGH